MDDETQQALARLRQEVAALQAQVSRAQQLASLHGIRHVDGTDYIWGEQTANYIFASPSGSAGGPGFRAATVADQPASLIKSVIPFIIGDGVNAITTGVKGFLMVPFDCTITGWDLIADASGSIVIDVWKDTYSNFPPTVADTIAGSEKPTLSTAQKNQDTSLSSWTTTLTGYTDWLGFNVDSATTVKQVTLGLRVTRT